MDPLKFNNLLWYYGYVNSKRPVPVEHLAQVEREVSQYVRNQMIIDALKRQSGVN